MDWIKKYFVQKPYLYILFLLAGFAIFLAACMLIEIPAADGSSSISLLSVIFERGGNA